MAPRLPIEICPERGYIALGNQRLPLVAETDGVLRVAGAARVRPVGFGEREDLVHQALGADDPAWALADLLATRSVLESGGLADDVLTAVAAVLAGGEQDTLSFVEVARRAGERERWSWERILLAPAWVVDRVATPGGDSDPAWSTIVFPASEPVDLNALARQICETLLRRSVDVDRPREASPQPRPRPSAVQTPAALDAFGTRRPPAENARLHVVANGRAVQPDPIYPRGITGTDGVNGSMAFRPVSPVVAPLQSGRVTTRVGAAERSNGATYVPAVEWAPPSVIAGASDAAESLRATRTRTPLPAIDPIVVARRTTSDNHASSLSTTARASGPGDARVPISELDAHSRTPGASLAPHTRQSAATDAEGETHWIDELARALDTECDLRGIVR